MSSLVLPTVPGIAWPVTRSLVTDSTIQQSISGMETRINNWSLPRWKWSLSYSILRSAAAFAEYQQLVGFINARYGQFDSFLYKDSDDNFVSGQQIGVGDGVTTVFQLVRSLGGFIEPVKAPNAAAGVSLFLNGSSTSAYALSVWGSPAGGGLVTFTTPPAAGVVITANINYYWPCRFDMDSFEFSQFMTGFYEMKKLQLISLKN